MAEDLLVDSPLCDTRLEALMVMTQKLILVGLWITCFVLDLYISCRFPAMLYTMLFLHIFLNGFLMKMLYNEFGVRRLLPLFLTLQIPLFLLGSGAWYGLLAWRHRKVDNLRSKWMLLARLSLVRVTKHSSEKLSFEGIPGHSLRSCLEPQADGAGITPEAEPVRMTRTEYVPGTKEIQMNRGSPLDGGELGVSTLLRFQELLGPVRKMSYHIVADSDETSLLHASCSDRLTEAFPNRILSRDPLAICNDAHYVLNLSSNVGHEVYSLTKRRLRVLTVIRGDLSKLVWLCTWILWIFKLYFCIFSFVKGMDTQVAMMFSVVLGFGILLLVEGALYQTITDMLILSGYRIFLAVMRAILLCGLGVLRQLAFIPFGFLTSRGAGLLAFYLYLSYTRRRRNVDLYRDEPTAKYTFSPVYEPSVQAVESLAYSCWSIYLYFSYRSGEALPFMLITVIGQVIGLAWLKVARPRLGQPLRDPSKVFQLVKQVEFLHL